MHPFIYPSESDVGALVGPCEEVLIEGSTRMVGEGTRGEAVGNGEQRALGWRWGSLSPSVS